MLIPIGVASKGLRRSGGRITQPVVHAFGIRATSTSAAVSTRAARVIFTLTKTPECRCSACGSL